MTGIRAVAVIVGIAVTLAGCGGSPASMPGNAHETATSAAGTAGAPHPDLGPFAGYVWTGAVNSAHADWTVPRLLPGSASGEAATWIGAEAPGLRHRAPFIQVGVNEGNTNGAGRPFYYGFYSTTALRFHPVHLFDVSPGDQISASLHRHGARWEIAFDDRTAGHGRQLSVAEGAGRRFNEAQFTQEDVTDARTSRPLPYPSLSPVRFTAVTANGAAPAPARLSSDWLTEGDGYLAPGPLQHDAFTLTHVQLTTGSLRYLRAIAIQDDATIFTTTQLLRWAHGGQVTGAVTAGRRFTEVLRATLAALDSQRWPASARAQVSASRSDTHALIALLATIPRVTTGRQPAWSVRYRRLTERVATDGQAVRRALRLPDSPPPAAAG